MKYYRIYSGYIDNEASFKVEEKSNALNNAYEPKVRLYKTPPNIFVKQSYSQRGMSDVLKAIDFIPHKKVVDALISHHISGVQLIPVNVGVDDVIYNDYWFMNVLARYPVLNIEASEADDYDVDWAAYTDVFKTILCKEKMASVNIQHDIFRCSECPDHIIANERVKALFEEYNFTGVTFEAMEVK